MVKIIYSRALFVILFAGFQLSVMCLASTNLYAGQDKPKNLPMPVPVPAPVPVDDSNMNNGNINNDNSGAAGRVEPQILTRERIEAFYKQAVDVQMSGIEEAMRFYRRHLHRDSKTVMNIISHMPGAQTQEEKLTFNKKQFMAQMRNSARTSKLKSLTSNIIKVSITNNGRRAEIKDTAFGESLVRVQSAEGYKRMNAEQSMFCNDELVLSDDNIIQLLKSRCDIELSFMP